MPAPRDASDPRPPEESQPQLSIAALDDDADFREFIASALEQEGHEARVFATPAELVRACEERTPDIILLDIKMGRHSGETVLGEIKSRWPRQCVIVITGYPTMDSMRETFKRDAFDYLAKPFSIEDLRQSIAQAAEAFDLGRRPQDRLRAELGRQIRLARAQKDWTLKELSEASGVSVSQLSSIERGAHLPSVESLLAIALALDEKPSEWLGAAGF
jgi:DNA-binding NtrC family response regulator